MTSPTEIKQFSKSQYDMPNGAMACSAIAVVAGTKFLKSSGRTRKSLWSDERVVDIIQSGVTLHRSWIQKYAGGDANTMVCVEELISLPEFSKTVEVKEWALGQYERDTLGKTLEQAIRDMTTSEQVRTKGCAAFVLTTQSHSTMVGVRRFDDYSSSAATGSLYGYKFVVFDSHTRDKATGLHIRTGKAITVRLADMTELLAYLSRLYATKTKPDELFSLHEICLKGKKKAKAGDTAVVRIPAADVEAQVIVGKADDCDLMASRLSSCADSDSAGSSISSSPTSTPAPPMSRMARHFTRLASITRRSSIPNM